MNQLAPIEPGARAAHAERIRALLTDWSRHTLLLGAELYEAQKTFPIERVLRKGRYRNARVGFDQWLKQEFGVTRGWANLLIRIHIKLGTRVTGISTTHTVLRLLAKPSTPESARHEIIERSRRGEKIAAREAKKIVVKHHPKPAEANKRARETGKPVLASDGFIYFGASKEEASAMEQRRSVVYGVRRVVDTLANMQVTPVQFIAYALPHQFHGFNQHNELARAAKWLAELDAAWNKK